MLRNASFNKLAVRLGPFDRTTDTLANIHLRLKAQLSGRFFGGGKPFAGAIPVARGAQIQWCGIARVFVDQGGQLENAGLFAGCKVVDATCRTFERTGHEAPCHVFNKDEVTAGVSAVI